jgi:FtsP/CotA-like multicopper oxidase with cupredoxin domain
MTNLHFHGLHVSPDAPQDDVISMMAMPGESLHYRVEIPLDQAPGLYWYHTHPHGESYQQSLDGMSGAIVIDGIDRYVPEVRSMRERILILRDADIKSHDSASLAKEKLVQMSTQRCNVVSEAPERIFTVNGVIRPSIAIAPGERQFWRIVNASPDVYADLEIDSEQMVIVALDGMPLAFHDPARHTEAFQHVLVPPAGRVEAIVTGPAVGIHASLRTSCVDTGKDGDPNPAMVLADLDTSVQAKGATIRNVFPQKPAIYKPLRPARLAGYESKAPDFTVKFTEDAHGFYINNQKYSPADGPMTQVTIGGYQHWRVINATDELHPFHIHQVHFLAYATNGKPEDHPNWLDTVNVPARGSVDLIMDFTDPIIRGMSVFHCHLLKHEDKGMMAKILFK